ncbi:MAG: hypothetical protein HYV27_08025 [Candidatus Hydrogenedentes bacterium]|nr:hypothetical protein [Candidatus Hydrogenedentota bacterium]
MADEVFKLINLSGHPIEQEGVCCVAGYGPVNVDLADPVALKATAVEMALLIVAHQGENELIPVALPGMVPLATHVLAAAHGLMGQFPSIAWASRNASGKFVWRAEQSTDLQAWRTELRISR